MRFLLSPAQRSAKAIARKSVDKRRRPETSYMSATVSSNETTTPHFKSWGQQCSPACGCVIRFEAKVDLSTQNIVDSQYQAKSVITDGKMNPVYTTRTQKPMFRECDCKTLHTLAEEISSFLPGKSVDQVRNMTEFTSSRSSPAFRHSVLVENGLPRTKTHCFDVVEEAFTAMIKGTMPTKRSNGKSFRQILVSEMALQNQSENGEDQRKLGVDKPRLSLSSPRSMSTLRMFDINNEYWENEYQEHFYQTSKESSQDIPRDWISYVDEQMDESA